MTEQENIKSFYDDFVSNQNKIGVSVRHRLIHKKLISIGLNNQSNVLEVGCGIGTVSSLIIPSIQKGHFLGCDISPKSIEIARKLNPQSNAAFLVTDMSDFSSEFKFDFIVFPDVLEHIPVDQHFNLFKNISAVCKDNSKLLINIPEPNSLEWIRQNKPELLQIIDQSLSMQDLLNNTYPHGFQVQSITPYAIHTDQPNYLSIVLVKKPSLKPVNLKGKFSQLYQNILARF